MGIFGKLAYDEGATVGTLLSTRFVVAAAVLWVFLLCSPADARAADALAPRRRAVPRSRCDRVRAQAGAYFAALDRIDASLLSLLLYTYPAMVTVAAIALGRERASGAPARAPWRWRSAGLVLLVAGAARATWMRWARHSGSRPRSSTAPTS